MNKVQLIQLRLALATGALVLLLPDRIGAQAPPSTQASSPQPSPTASPTPTSHPALGTVEVERVVVMAMSWMPWVRRFSHAQSALRWIASFETGFKKPVPL